MKVPAKGLANKNLCNVRSPLFEITMRPGNLNSRQFCLEPRAGGLLRLLRSCWSIGLIAGLLAGNAIRVCAEDLATRFEEANKLYEQGRYPDAAKAYAELVKVGQVSSALYFNLGNALLK